MLIPDILESPSAAERLYMLMIDPRIRLDDPF